MSIDTFRKGDHWVIDDRTGERIRSSEARQEWNGQVVHKDDYEERHPQELVRPIKDDQRPHGYVRPQEIPVSVGPLNTTLTADVAAGATALTVDATVRFQPGDKLRIMLDSGDAFRTAVFSITDSTHLTITPGLPFKASSGNQVVNESAVAAADIG